MSNLFLVIILVIFTGCSSQPVNITIQNEIQKNKILCQVYDAKTDGKKIYFDLELSNHGEKDKLLIITLDSFELNDNSGNRYSIYINELLANKTSREIYLKKGSNVRLSFYAVVDDKIHNAVLIVKDNTLSNLPFLHKKYEEKVKNISTIYINYTSFNGNSVLNAIGYTIECKNNKEFYIELSSTNRITIYDRQKKKDILEFERAEIDTQMKKICTY